MRIITEQSLTGLIRRLSSGNITKTLGVHLFFYVDVWAVPTNTTMDDNTSW
jgi:hypothetical protein